MRTRALRDRTEQWVIKKYHGLIQESVTEAIAKSNFDIQFVEPSWVIKVVSGGFTGRIISRELVELDTIPFGVMSVDKDKKKQCSTIYIWNDGVCDGYHCYLINVPNGLFKQISERSEE